MREKLNAIARAWVKTTDEVVHEAGTHAARGLTATEAVVRYQAYGANMLSVQVGRSPVFLFVQQFMNPLAVILMVTVGVTLFLQEYLDASIIALALLTSVVLGFYQEYKADRATRALASYLQMRVRVLRDGKEHEIDAYEVVVGDVLMLRAGERVPADARVISSTSAAVDESVLTGESLPVHKQSESIEEAAGLPDRTNMLYGGTFVREGVLRAVVVATGVATEFGKLAQEVMHAPDERTPLQEAMRMIGWYVTVITVLLVILLYGVGIMRGMPHLDVFLIAVAVAVSAIPEALSPGVTAVLAVGVERIAKRGGIVRSLLAAETLGSATVILSDKTGTLTEGRMELVDTYALDGLLAETSPRVATHAQNHALLSLALRTVSSGIENPDAPHTEWIISGRALEMAIVRASAGKVEGISAILGTSEDVKLFNSRDKFSIVRAHVAAHDALAHMPSGTLEIALGAPDILLAHSDMPAHERAQANAAIHALTYEGKRIVGLAVRHAKNSHGLTGFTFAGILVFYDPLRDGVRAAIKEIESTGVRVIMATGDLPGTAYAIASQLGWELSPEQVITGSDVERMSAESLIDAVAHARVFARMTPDDKYRVIEALQARKEIVAMLGDGVNDAPSIKRANVGVAIGSGTDVAKGVADLVLLRDDFHTVKAAIDEGKLILANIRKMFIYLMSNSFDELFVIGGAMLLALPLPLTALQIIWVNFVTGSIPAIAFAFDREHGGGAHRSRSVLNRDVKMLTFGLGGVTSFMLLVLYVPLVWYGNFDQAVINTFMFACFSAYALIIAFSIRNIHKPLGTYPIFANMILNIGVIFGFVMLTATIYLPSFQNIFGTVALSAPWLIAAILWLVANIYLIEFTKNYLRRA